ELTLEFDGTSSDLTADTQQKLVNIIPHLRESKARRLAVHAYASGEDGSKTSARRISLSRALAVRSFLMDNGVEPTRVDVRALGLETDRKPLERVDLVFAR
ncbi:MAG: OmpA family protein, partial [Alphaproteobacteria bacterium]|nr:OmpA family protein [Alphaproteobacteria bacterium]